MLQMLKNLEKRDREDEREFVMQRINNAKEHIKIDSKEIEFLENLLGLMDSGKTHDEACAEIHKTGVQ